MFLLLLLFLKHLQLEQIKRQNTARQYTEQMEELCSSHKYVSRAHQIIIGNDGLVLGMMHKVLARNNVADISLWFLPGMSMLHLVEIVLGMLFGILVYITVVDVELLIDGFLFEWM